MIIKKIKKYLICFSSDYIFVSSDLSWLCIDIVHVVSTIESRDEAN